MGIDPRDLAKLRSQVVGRAPRTPYEVMRAQQGLETPADRKQIRRRHGDPEGKLQTACVDWFRKTFPEKVIFAIPNGGVRSRAEAGRMKGQGVLAGVPDLFVAHVAADRGGLFIEMKADRASKSTDLQVAMQKQLQAAGYTVSECRSLEEFKNLIHSHIQ